MNNFDNLLIMKTMSKVGLAGLRLGYLFGETSIIKQINKLRLPFNINSFSQKISELYTGDNDFIDAQTKEIIKSREYMLDSMKKIKNIKVYPSKTNFILFRILKGSADIVFRSLLADKLLVKNMSSTPSLKNCLRVTVGTREENDIFIQSLKNCNKLKNFHTKKYYIMIEYRCNSYSGTKKGNLSMSDGKPDKSRRKFLTGSLSIVGGTVGAAATLWPFISSMAPSAKAKAAGAPVRVDISELKDGEKIDLIWRKKPIWVVKRTKDMLESINTTKKT